jgi:enoyl-CoA hydratase/carnithine racemase
MSTVQQGSGVITAVRTNVLLELEDGAAVVTMNRPERRNALSLEHMEELTATLREIADQSAAPVVILRGNGPAFCSGHDLGEMVGRDAEFYERLFRACTVLMETIQAIPQPVIAEVHGIATAAGCQLVATCDLAVASEEARFATPGVKIGLFCSTPMVALTRNVGRKKALEMLLTGEALSAEEARLAGLVNRVVAADELHDATRRLAATIAAASPRVVAVGKEAYYRQIELPVGEAYEYTRAVMAANAAAADAQEGMGAFLEKRAPVWGDR